MNKQQLLEMLESKPAPFDSADYSEQQIQIFDNTAVVTSLFHGLGDSLDLRQRFMRVYAKRNQVWQCVATQVIPLA